MPVLSLAVGKAEEDILNFSYRLANALISRCLQEIEDNVDITESLSMEALVNIIDVSLHPCRLAQQCMKCWFERILIELWLQSLNMDVEDVDENGDESKESSTLSREQTKVAGLIPKLVQAFCHDDEIPFVPDLLKLVSFMIKHSASPDGEESKEFEGPSYKTTLSIVTTVAEKLPSWWSELSECDDCWDVVMELASYAEYEQHVTK